MDEQSEPRKEKDPSRGLLRPKLSEEGTQPGGGGGVPGSRVTWPPAGQEGLFGSAQHLAATAEADSGPGHHWATIAKLEQRESNGGC